MLRTKVAALAVALAITSLAGLGAASANITDNRFEEKTQDYLREMNIAEGDVESIRIVVQRRKNERGPDIIGAESWIRLNSCGQGYLVLQMTRGAFVKQAYTRGDCSVPGLANH